MFKLLGMAAAAAAGYRAFQANRMGIPLDAAFKPQNIFKPLADFKRPQLGPSPRRPGDPAPALDPDDVMTPDFSQW